MLKYTLRSTTWSTQQELRRLLPDLAQFDPNLQRYLPRLQGVFPELGQVQELLTSPALQQQLFAGVQGVVEVVLSGRCLGYLQGVFSRC